MRRALLLLAVMAATLRGTDGPDWLTGTEESDRIFALGGLNLVEGLGGNDFIDGGAGHDLHEIGNDFWSGLIGALAKTR